MGALNLLSSITLLNKTEFETHVVNDESLLKGEVKSMEVEIELPNGRTDADNKNTMERIIINKPATGDVFRISVQSSNFGPGYTEQKYSFALAGCFHRAVNIPSPFSARLPTVMFESPLPMSTLNEVVTIYDTNRRRYSGIMISVQAKIYGIQTQSFKVQCPVIGLVRVDAYTKVGELRGPDLKSPANWTKIADLEL